MGDRITTYLPCPECGEETEQYDAASSLIWNWNCGECGWVDDREYWEVGDNEIFFGTEEQYKIRMNELQQD
jgi:rubredoxin